MTIVQNQFDIIGIGTVAVDYIASVESWPACGDKQPFSDFTTCDGGNTATALVTVAQLGGRAAFIGKMSHSDVSQRSRQSFRQAGVDTSLVIHDDHAEPIVAFVISSKREHQRTILYSLDRFQCPTLSELPDTDAIQHAKFLLIDHNSGQGGVEAAQLAKRNGVKIIIDVERSDVYVDTFLDLADHIVVPEAFARLVTGEDAHLSAVQALKKHKDQTVIATRGENGCLGIAADDVFEIPGIKVDVVDTTGCGDVFHGAYAWALLQDLPAQRAAAIANAAAAMSATKMGGRAGIPNYEQLSVFSRERHVNVDI